MSEQPKKYYKQQPGFLFYAVCMSS